MELPDPDEEVRAVEDDAGASPAVPADQPFYTIGQVAQLLDVPAAQLRRLDALEIVQPDRTEGNQRRYSAREIERLREVITLGEEGVTLPGVRKILELRRRVGELEDQLSRQADELADARRDAGLGARGEAGAAAPGAGHEG
ncbi:hypothetical protein DNL40_04405 [Xylanimonas oleitrophica]|uniref:HTH merR-type domain-containing protein n=1 Tax=Xylanimonas oleitrophica TaxID=2607479 RepID=A0A2W5WRN6_9MICO|nr:MerR family transcriptional regulator [Xylanimonas oleitrophica]PZR54179.1 hypothetical protein DNL40_04405 [Xylanimonas oleitrophica]